MKKQKNNIILSAGGTGGHVFPALSLAESFSKKHPDVNCYFLTDSRIFNSKKYNLSMCKKAYKIQGAGIVNLSLIKKLFNGFKLGLGLLQSLYYIFVLKPKLIVSFGGYITLPVAFAGRFFKISLVIHEQNKVSSSTNVLLSSFASSVALSFKDTKNLNGKNTVYTGMPIRDVFFKLQSTKKDDSKISFAFLGGSLGADVFGENIANAFASLDTKTQGKCIVYHQCRQENMQEVVKIFENTKVDFKVQPFFTEIEDIMQKSDLIFTRSGASTVFEVLALNKYAIFVPYKKAFKNHQYENALQIQKQGSAEICLEDDFTQTYLQEKLVDIINNFETAYKNKASNKQINGSLELLKLCEKYI